MCIRVPEGFALDLVQERHHLGGGGGIGSKAKAVVGSGGAGVNYGASDPRKDGAAVPEPAPYF
ncbi:MAG TPA: hypothetical protein VN893_18555 [Bryobacteraceae bacterium]|nr:hypothetical protein [Bryobacteraceae bacterium]